MFAALAAGCHWAADYLEDAVIVKRQSTALPPALEAMKRSARERVAKAEAERAEQERTATERNRSAARAAIRADLPADLLAASDVDRVVEALGAHTTSARVTIRFPGHRPLVAEYNRVIDATQPSGGKWERHHFRKGIWGVAFEDGISSHADLGDALVAAELSPEKSADEEAATWEYEDDGKSD